MKRVLFNIVFLSAAFLATPVFAQPGSLDISFGVQGKLIIALGNIGDQLNSVAIQSDQKIVMGGYTRSSFTSSDFALVRSNIDGSLDESFGIGGKVITPIELRSVGNSVAIQNDGKILLGGSSDWFINLARYTYDGKLDGSFGTGGIVITDVDGYYSETCNSVVIQADGKILVGGYAQHDSNDKSYFILARYLEDGVLDGSFGSSGIVIGGVGKGNSIAIQSDGKILLGGSSENNFAITRYHANGTLDTDFGIAGVVITPIGLSSGGNSLCIQKDGKLILCGYSKFNSTGGFALVRYNQNGSLDNSFGNNGKVFTEIGSVSATGNSVSIQTDGKIVVGGNAVKDANISDLAIVRYKIDGELDTAFGTGGMLITSIGASYSMGNSLKIQSDGKIILGGYAYNGVKTEMVLERFENDINTNTEDFGLSKTGINIYPNPFNTQTTIQFKESILHNAEINIYNSMGVKVCQIENISGEKIQLYRNHLAPGIYYLQLLVDHKVVSLEKLIAGEE